MLVTLRCYMLKVKVGAITSPIVLPNVPFFTTREVWGEITLATKPNMADELVVK